MLTQEFVVWMGRRVQESAEFEQDEVLPTRYVHDRPMQSARVQNQSRSEVVEKKSPLSSMGFASCCGF